VPAPGGQQVVGAKVVGGQVRGELAHDLAAHTKLAVLLVLWVVLHPEPGSGGMVLAGDRDHRTADGEQPVRDVDVAARSSVSFAPPQPGLDGRLHQQLRVGVRQGRVERVELRGR
jgi:hypothetical protein